MNDKIVYSVTITRSPINNAKQTQESYGLVKAASEAEALRKGYLMVFQKSRFYNLEEFNWTVNVEELI